MSWGARQWLRLTPETTYGVWNGANTPLWIRMDRDQFFTMRPKSLLGVLPTADAGNRRVQAWKNMSVYNGGLATPAYPSQIGLLLSLGLHLVPNGTDIDLQSFTIDHFDTKRPVRYLGCKIAKGTLSAAQAQDNGKASLMLQIVAQNQDVPDVSFVEQPITAYPAENPYLYGQTAGHILLGGVRTRYKAMEFSFDNTLDATVDELAYISSLVYCGRKVDWTFDCQYQATTDRTNFEAGALQSGSVGFIRDAQTGLVLTLNTANLIASVDDDMGLNKATYQKITLQNMYDISAGSDVTGSITFPGASPVTF